MRRYGGKDCCCSQGLVNGVGSTPRARLRGFDQKNSTLDPVFLSKTIILVDKNPGEESKLPVHPPLHQSLVLTRIRTGLWCSNNPSVTNQTKHDSCTCKGLLDMSCHARSCPQGSALHSSASLSLIPAGRHQIYGSVRKAIVTGKAEGITRKSHRSSRLST